MRVHIQDEKEQDIKTVLDDIITSEIKNEELIKNTAEELLTTAEHCEGSLVTSTAEALAAAGGVDVGVDAWGTGDGVSFVDGFGVDSLGCNAEGYLTEN
ncbi:unnamed protein product [Cyprideis torosa]|uniref:Uncharacterized protein n=1 Tax=Cyprideis torosa TaxID=163714 RepID=A0A7R8ZX17_9CRUS|nr:unnamed protein product [Cyprideis torosa]CAD7234962.1 unnamed protein product [Cyprideis torosa]CAG0906007.1 unnamed protein product [Cyprideis torosa]CAG0906097.1 unnamed protein product [Cyprideis torosa]